MRLAELLKTYNSFPQDVSLFHCDYNKEFPIMLCFSMKAFTESELKGFNSVLNAEVFTVMTMERNWVSVCVRGVPYSHIEKFASAYAGYISRKVSYYGLVMESCFGQGGRIAVLASPCFPERC